MNPIGRRAFDLDRALEMQPEFMTNPAKLKHDWEDTAYPTELWRSDSLVAGQPQ